AQVTQSEADSIVLERLSTDSRPHSVFAKDNLQADTANISTALGELLELDYPCWIYYVRYDEQADTIPAKRRYFVVKESSGRVLMVNTHNNVSPPDLETWRKVPPDEPPLDSLVLIAKGNLAGSEGIPKQNLVITTQTDWENLITAMNSVNNLTDSFAEINIDFSKYQIIAVFDEVKSEGGWSVDITDITEHSNGIRVSYANLETGDSTSVVTQPFYIVKIPASPKPVFFMQYPLCDSFTEYTFDGTACRWAYNIYGNDTVVFIDDNNDLGNYIMTLGDSFPTVDFSTHTVILAYGQTINVNNVVSKNFQQLSPYEYKLDVEVFVTNATMPMSWIVAFIVCKQNSSSSVELNVTIINNY
ncbi:MAG: hypothetical protein FWH36_00205, partial [Lentimicrobiaceae bacterium]|nr:hypothetical protein [Lentimicrobiaceae bacterium]